MLFFTQQRTQHFPKLLLGITTKVAFLDVTLLASLKIVYTGNFLELKTLAEKCIGCDERDSVVTLFLYQTIKSLSVCTWKKLQKKPPQICAQAVGIMYNTYGNFFVLAFGYNTL